MAVLFTYQADLIWFLRKIIDKGMNTACPRSLVEQALQQLKAAMK